MRAVRIPELEEIHLNLIPIMNLFTALIPFLLLSAAFFHMGVIQVTVPVASSDGSVDAAKAEDKITLNLRITQNAFVLSASSDTIDPQIIAVLKSEVKRSGGKFSEKDPSWEALSQQALKIKGDYVQSDTVIVSPAGDVPYEDVVAALDAVRMATVQRGESKSRVALFSKPVLASMVGDGDG